MSGETRCRICGRLLTNLVSVERGVGPVCWARLPHEDEPEDAYLEWVRAKEEYKEEAEV